jgi:CBS domain-containing protein
MCTPRGDECVLESDLLEVAIHKMVIGRHQSILVTGADGIVGILTLADVLEQIARGCEDWDE